MEVRRHSHRKAGAGSQLSQTGVDLARRVGMRSGPYVEVVTSVLPRARETAIAMGFAVDRELVTQLTDEDVLGAFDLVDSPVSWYDQPDAFAALHQVLYGAHVPAAQADVLHRWSQTLAALWRDLMTPYGNGDERVLFIGHSGDLEAGLISCLPKADHVSWGPRLKPMEGAVLEFAGEPARFRRAELLRVE